MVNPFALASQAFHADSPRFPLLALLFLLWHLLHVVWFKLSYENESALRISGALLQSYKGKVHNWHQSKKKKIKIVQGSEETAHKCFFFAKQMFL